MTGRTLQRPKRVLVLRARPVCKRSFNSLGLGRIFASDAASRPPGSTWSSGVNPIKPSQGQSAHAPPAAPHAVAVTRGQDGDGDIDHLPVPQTGQEPAGRPPPPAAPRVSPGTGNSAPLFLRSTDAALHQDRAGSQVLSIKPRPQMKGPAGVSAPPPPFPPGKCSPLRLLKVHRHLIKILRKGMCVAKLALKRTT